MEGNTGQEHIRSCSDTSALTAVNAKQQSPSWISNLQERDDSRAWTDEKHNSYLNHLEMSFITQLKQSKEQPQPVRCSVRDPFQGQFIDNDEESDQFTILRNGNWLKIKYRRSAAPFTAYKASLVGSNKSMEVYSPPPADSPKLKRICNTEERDEGGLLKCSRKFPCSTSCDDSAMCTREGTGQNFCDDGDRNETSIGSPMKRLKTTSADCSIQDQTVPSRDLCGNGAK